MRHHKLESPGAPHPPRRASGDSPWRRLRKGAAAVLTAGLVAGALTVAPGLFDAAAQARFATDGAGDYKGVIDWFEWGADGTEFSEGSTMTKTNTRVVAGKNVETTCTISNIDDQTGDGGIQAYRPGDWKGDQFDELYNIGGTGTDNQLVAGLVNTLNPGSPEFDFSCTVKVDGTVLPLEGLTVASAESNSAGEWIKVTPVESDAKWRILEESAVCPTVHTKTILDPDNSLTITLGDECFQDGEDWGSNPVAVGFVENATAAHVQLVGGGRTAIALGVVFSIDFGDAPASYGEAAAVVQPEWAGGEVPSGTSTVEGYPLATEGPAALRLGKLVDGDAAAQPSADALADDQNNQADEDGIAQPGTITVTPGGRYTKSVACAGTGFVAGWVDWNANGTFDAGERSSVVACSGGSASLVWTVPADVAESLDAKTFMRLRIAADEAGASAPTGLVMAGEVEDYALNVAVNELEVVKTSDATVNTRVGDTVTYTVKATNTGDADFTDAAPARVIDDLTGLLDDADYAGDAQADKTGDLSYTAPKLQWAGPLAAGETVTLTYSVQVKAGGDRVMKNVAFTVPPCDQTDCPPPVTPECPPETTTISCTENLLPALKIEKQADRTQAPKIGERVTYTVKVTNAGPGAYTKESPATAIDDLTDVLDAATWADDAQATSGSLSYQKPKLTWTGALAAGESATITYSVVYTGAGDRNLLNTVCLDPQGQVLTGEDACKTVEIPDVVAWKTVDPTSGTALVAGQSATYTLHFRNTSEKLPVNVDHEDVLSNVLDDADVTVQPKSSDPALAVSAISSGTFSVTGELAAGEIATVTYTVQVKADGARGDDLLGNFLVNTGVTPPEECEPKTGELPDCTVNPVSSVKIVKSSDPKAGSKVEPGQKVTYTVTVTQQGKVPADATFVDDMAGVSDDAVYNDDVKADIGTATVKNGKVVWSGTVPVGGVAKVTYSVTVKDLADVEKEGDFTLKNLVTYPGVTKCLPDNSNCTVHPIGAFDVVKTADPKSGTAVESGQKVSYTVTVTQKGEAEADAEFIDDLAGVSDDAVFNGDVMATSGTAVVKDGKIAWSGKLPVGGVAKVTYSVTVKDLSGIEKSGDFMLKNFVTYPGVEKCLPGDPNCTVHPVGAFDVVKTADPESGSQVGPGQKVAYTVTVSQKGEAGVDAKFTDDLAGVSDDAVYNGDIKTDIGTASVQDGKIVWAGKLPVDGVAKVTYSVTVKQLADIEKGGDFALKNLVTYPGVEKCLPDDSNCTVHPVGVFAVAKSADPESGSTVEPGQTITYTIAVTQTGAVPADAEFVDDLAEVTDDAVFNDDVRASLGTAEVRDGKIYWNGTLPVGGVAKVTYSVTVKDMAGLKRDGDFFVENVVTSKGCVSAGDCTTNHKIEKPSLVVTGGVAMAGVAFGAVLLLGAGVLLMAVKRRRRDTELAIDTTHTV